MALAATELTSILTDNQKNDTFTQLKMLSLLSQITNKTLSVTTGFVLVCRDRYVWNNGDVRL